MKFQPWTSGVPSKLAKPPLGDISHSAVAPEDACFQRRSVVPSPLKSLLAIRFQPWTSGVPSKLAPPLGDISHSAVAPVDACCHSKSVVPSPLRYPADDDVPSRGCRRGWIVGNAAAWRHQPFGGAADRVPPQNVFGAVVVEVTAGHDVPQESDSGASREYNIVSARTANPDPEDAKVGHAGRKVGEQVRLCTTSLCEHISQEGVVERPCIWRGICRTHVGSAFGDAFMLCSRPTVAAGDASLLKYVVVGVISLSPTPRTCACVPSPLTTQFPLV